MIKLFCIVCREATNVDLFQTAKLLVNTPSGCVVQVELVYNEDTLCERLFSKVEEATSIPASVQMLTIGGKMLQPDVPLHQYGIDDYRCANLLVKGIGGGGSDTGTYLNAVHNYIMNTLVSVYVQNVFIVNADEVM